MNNIQVKLVGFISKILSKFVPNKYFLTKKIKMKNYFLTVVSEFKNETHIQDIILAITPIVDSTNIKFQYNKGGVTFIHFGSEVNKQDIYTYITGVMYGVSDIFVLTEINDELTVSLPKELKSFLMNLEGSGDGQTFNMDEIKANQYLQEEYDDYDDEYDDILNMLKSAKKPQIKQPSLDTLLDKIKDGGIESLTKLEKEQLENYSKDLI